MDFMSMITADNEVAFVEEAQALSEQEERKKDIVAQRAKIVTEAVAQFAESLGFESVELTKNTERSGRFFLVGGFVFVVRLHGHIDKRQLEAVKRPDVLWQHTIALVGVDITGRIMEVGKGTLKVVSYESIRKVFNGHIDLDFSCEKVISVLMTD